MRKFKVGDKIKIRKWSDMAKEYGVDTRGHISSISPIFNKMMKPLCGRVGTITTIIGDKVGIDFEDKSGSIGWTYTTKMIEPAVQEKIVIYSNGNDVVAVNKVTGEKGVAHCHPDDEFKFGIGASIAFARLQGREPFEPISNVTFRALAIKDYKNHFSKGRVYEAIDGKITYDDGLKGSRYKSFKDYIRCNKLWSDYLVELKPGDDPAEVLEKYEVYNCKFVALISRNGLTKGRIYELKDGFFIDDTDNKFPQFRPAIRDKADMYDYFENNIIEIVE